MPLNPPSRPPPNGKAALLAIALLFFIGVLIGFVLGRAL